MPPEGRRHFDGSRWKAFREKLRNGNKNNAQIDEAPLSPSAPFQNEERNAQSTIEQQNNPLLQSEQEASIDRKPLKHTYKAETRIQLEQFDRSPEQLNLRHLSHYESKSRMGVIVGKSRLQEFFRRVFSDLGETYDPDIHSYNSTELTDILYRFQFKYDLAKDGYVNPFLNGKFFDKVMYGVVPKGGSNYFALEKERILHQEAQNGVLPYQPGEQNRDTPENAAPKDDTEGFGGYRRIPKPIPPKLNEDGLIDVQPISGGVHAELEIQQEQKIEPSVQANKNMKIAEEEIISRNEDEVPSALQEHSELLQLLPEFKHLNPGQSGTLLLESRGLEVAEFDRIRSETKDQLQAKGWECEIVSDRISTFPDKYDVFMRLQKAPIKQTPGEDPIETSPGEGEFPSTMTQDQYENQLAQAQMLEDIMGDPITDPIQESSAIQGVPSFEELKKLEAMKKVQDAKRQQERAKKRVQDLKEVDIDGEDLSFFSAFGDAMMPYVDKKDWTVTKNATNYFFTCTKVNPDGSESLHYGKRFTVEKEYLDQQKATLDTIESTGSRSQFVDPTHLLKQYLVGKSNEALMGQ